MDIRFNYTVYDKVSNRRKMKVDDEPEQVYEYDCLYELTSVDYNDGNSTDYYYDTLGNRTKTYDGSSVSYSRNRLNQYSEVGGVEYEYDNNGNLIDDGEYLYYYDCENRLTEVNDQNDEHVAVYVYDFAGRRVRKIVYGETNVVTKYCYDGYNVR